ncbi:MAG: Zinc protease [Myxococcaceae bacterium]|nr:Zinc protease [Myxococcaceae bacterium]
MSAVTTGSEAPKGESPKTETTSTKASKARAATERVDLEGGTIVLLEQSHALPIVNIIVALRSGAAHDPLGKEGVTRITARMLRRGSKGIAAREVEDAIDRLGSELSVDVTVSTTAVYGQVIKRSLTPFVELMARVLCTPEFPEDELLRLKRETVAEIVEARDNDRAVAQRAFRRAMFGSHLYGRSSGGTTKSIESITQDDAKAVFAKHFRKGNIVIAFSGDITKDEAVVAAKELMKGLPDGGPLPDPVTPPSMVPGRRLVFVDKPERTQTQILIGTLGTSPHDDDHHPLTIANAVFGGTFTSRLMREVRSKRGWSYGASARMGIDRQRHTFTMWTFPAATDCPPCIELELDLLESFVKKGITPKELAFIKRYLTRSYAFEIDTAAKRLHQALDIELLGLPADYYSGYLGHVASVTEASANAAVLKRISTDDLLIVVVGTASELLDGVKSKIPNLASDEVVPFDRE